MDRSGYRAGVLPRIALLGCVVMIAACGAAPRPQPRLGPPETSATLPALVYPIEGGGELATAAHRGQVIVLDVWATYCKPCRKSFPLLDRLAAARPDVLVVGLSLDEEDPPVAAFLREVPAAFVIARDRTLSISTGPLQVTKLPTLFLIDRAGRVRMRLDEPDERDYDALPALVDELRAEPAPPP